MSALPGWFSDEVRHVVSAGVSHTLLLYGDIHGIFPNPDADDEPETPYMSLRNFLARVLDSREIVAYYNIASGLTFPDPSAVERFRAAAGLADRGGSDPIAAARAGLAEKRRLPTEPELAMPLLERVLQRAERSAVVIWSVHTLAPTVSPGIPLAVPDRANIERLKNWAADEAIREKGGLVVLVTAHAGDVHRELRHPGSGIHPVHIPRPDAEERKTFLSTIPEVDVDLFARATQGMTLRQIRDLFLRAKEKDAPLDLAFVKARKQELLNQEYGDVMEVMEPLRGLDDIGGCEHVKKYFRDVLDALRRGDARLVPMGVTLMGPPGTGKTALVEGLAREAGFTFVKTRSIRSMWVGESESRMEKLLEGLRGLAPVVVMNDEADLAEQSRDAPRGDSGVSERLMKMWMELLSDPRIRGQIIVISCTNRPDRIDAALKRSGRSDERILLPMPSWDERVAILEVLFRRYDIPLDTQPQFFGEATEGMSGADLEKVVLAAWRFAVEAGEAKVGMDTLTRALRDFIPSANQEEIDRMTLIGIMECSSRRLLPGHIKDIVDQIARRRLVDDVDEWLAKIRGRQILVEEA
ncbi:MAG: ATP-binding protein [Armatimonadetes bacterium]|nr:ATP-binding protein [Armatimonadota bacterium]